MTCELTSGPLPNTRATRSQTAGSQQAEGSLRPPVLRETVAEQRQRARAAFG